MVFSSLVNDLISQLRRDVLAVKTKRVNTVSSVDGLYVGPVVNDVIGQLSCDVIGFED